VQIEIPALLDAREKVAGPHASLADKDRDAEQAAEAERRFNNAAAQAEAKPTQFSDIDMDIEPPTLPRAEPDLTEVKTAEEEVRKAHERFDAQAKDADEVRSAAAQQAIQLAEKRLEEAKSRSVGGNPEKVITQKWTDMLAANPEEGGVASVETMKAAKDKNVTVTPAMIMDMAREVEFWRSGGKGFKMRTGEGVESDPSPEYIKQRVQDSRDKLQEMTGRFNAQEMTRWSTLEKGLGADAVPARDIATALIEAQQTAPNKMNEAFLQKFEDYKFKQDGGEDPSLTGPERETLRNRARSAARRALTSLHEIGWWPTEVSVEDVKDPTLMDYAKAAWGPTVTILPGGRAVRTESILGYAMRELANPFALPIWLARRAGGDDISLYRMLRERPGAFEAQQEMDQIPVMREALKADFKPGTAPSDMAGGDVMEGRVRGVRGLPAATLGENAKAAAPYALATAGVIEPAIEPDALTIMGKVPGAVSKAVDATKLFDSASEARVASRFGRYLDLPYIQAGEAFKLADHVAARDPAMARLLEDHVAALVAQTEEGRAVQDASHGKTPRRGADVDAEVLADKAAKDAVESGRYDEIVKRAEREAIDALNRPQRGGRPTRDVSELIPGERLEERPTDVGPEIRRVMGDAADAKVLRALTEAADVPSALRELSKAGAKPAHLRSLASKLLDTLDKDPALRPVVDAVTERVLASYAQGKVQRADLDLEVVRRLVHVQSDAGQKVVQRMEAAVAKRKEVLRKLQEEADTNPLRKAASAAVRKAEADLKTAEAQLEKARSRTPDLEPGLDARPGGVPSEDATVPGRPGDKTMVAGAPAGAGTAPIPRQGAAAGGAAVTAKLDAQAAAVKGEATADIRDRLDAHRAIGVAAALEPLDPAREAQRAGRYGPAARMHFAHAGEPYLRPDFIQRPPMEYALRRKAHLLFLALMREHANDLATGKYLSGADAADFCKQFGLPTYPDWTTPSGFFKLEVREAGKPGAVVRSYGSLTREQQVNMTWEVVGIRWTPQADAFWRQMDAIAAQTPDLPRARALNEYLRSLLPWSDPFAQEGDVDLIRLKDTVFVQDPAVAAKVGPIKQPVEVMEGAERKIRFQDAVTDGLSAEVVGFKDGKVLLQPMEFVDGTPRRSPRHGPVLVDADKLLYMERGRVPRTREGRRFSYTGPMTRREWETVRRMEDNTPGARTLRYSDKERFIKLAPPERPTVESFDFQLSHLPEGEREAARKAMDAAAEARGVPTPRFEGAKSTFKAQQTRVPDLPRIQEEPGEALREEQAFSEAFTSLPVGERVSMDMIQRTKLLGYNKAKDFLDQLKAQGLVDENYRKLAAPPPAPPSAAQLAAARGGVTRPVSPAATAPVVPPAPVSAGEITKTQLDPVHVAQARVVQAKTRLEGAQKALADFPLKVLQGPLAERIAKRTQAVTDAEGKLAEARNYTAASRKLASSMTEALRGAQEPVAPLAKRVSEAELQAQRVRGTGRVEVSRAPSPVRAYVEAQVHRALDRMGVGGSGESVSRFLENMANVLARLNPRRFPTPDAVYASLLFEHAAVAGDTHRALRSANVALDGSRIVRLVPVEEELAKAVGDLPDPEWHSLEHFGASDLDTLSPEHHGAHGTQRSSEFNRGERGQGLNYVGRVHFYPAGEAPEPGIAQGAQHKYTVRVQGRIYDFKNDPRKFKPIAQAAYQRLEDLPWSERRALPADPDPMNEFERVIVDAGYDGYAWTQPDGKKIVTILDRDVPVIGGEMRPRSDLKAKLAMVPDTVTVPPGVHKTEVVRDARNALRAEAYFAGKPMQEALLGEALGNIDRYDGSAWVYDAVLTQLEGGGTPDEIRAWMTTVLTKMPPKGKTSAWTEGVLIGVRTMAQLLDQRGDLQRLVGMQWANALGFSDELAGLDRRRYWQIRATDRGVRLYSRTMEPLGLYSGARKAIEAIPTNKPLEAKQLLQTLENTKGVSPVELDERDIREFLQEKAASRQKVTKAELLQFIDENERMFREIQLTHMDPAIQKEANELSERLLKLQERDAEVRDEITDMYNALDDLEMDLITASDVETKDAIGSQMDHIHDTLNQLRKESEQVRAERNRALQQRNDLIARQNASSPQYSQYAVRGGDGAFSNYREVLLTRDRAAEASRILNQIEDLKRQAKSIQDRYHAARREWLAAPIPNELEGPEAVQAAVIQRKYMDAHAEWADAEIRIREAVNAMTKMSDEFQYRLYTSSHYGDRGENLLATVRISTVEHGGRPYILIHEVQSDLDQFVRNTLEELERWDKGGQPDNYYIRQLRKAVMDYRQLLGGFEGRTTEVMLKRVLRIAAEEGAAGVIWEPGWVQAHRWSNPDRMVVQQLTLQPGVNEQGNVYRLRAFNERGHAVASKDIESEAELRGLLGDRLANKMLTEFHSRWDASGNWGHYDVTEPVSVSAEHLVVGGKLYTDLYDNIIPNFLKKYTKESLGTIDIGDDPRNVAELTDALRAGNYAFELPDRPPVRMQYVPMTPRLRERIMEGQPLYQHAPKKTNEVTFPMFVSNRPGMGAGAASPLPPEHIEKYLGSPIQGQLRQDFEQLARRFGVRVRVSDAAGLYQGAGENSLAVIATGDEGAINQLAAAWNLSHAQQSVGIMRPGSGWFLVEMQLPKGLSPGEVVGHMQSLGLDGATAVRRADGTHVILGIPNEGNAQDVLSAVRKFSDEQGGTLTTMEGSFDFLGHEQSADILRVGGHDPDAEARLGDLHSAGYGDLERRADEVEAPREQHAGNFLYAMRGRPAGVPQTEAGVVHGMFEARFGKGLITLFETADFSTLHHELMHFVRRALPPEMLTEVEKALGINDGWWTEAAEEAFVAQMQQAVKDGFKPTGNVVLDRALRQVGLSLMDVAENSHLHVNAELRKAFDALHEGAGSVVKPVIHGTGDMADLNRTVQVMDQSLNLSARGTVRAHIEDALKSLGQWFRSARDVDDASLKEAVRVWARMEEAELSAFNKRLGDIITGRGGTGRDPLSALVMGRDDLGLDLVSALDAGVDARLLDALAKSFIDTEKVPLSDIDLGLLRSALKQRGTVADIANNLEAASLEVINRHLEFGGRGLRDRYTGRALFAHAAGTAAIQHRAERAGLGIGAVLGETDYRATTEWIAGTHRSHRGRQLVLQAIDDPFNYVPPIGSGLTREKVLQFSSVGQKSRAGAAVEKAVDALDGNSVYIPRAVRNRFVNQIDAVEKAAHPSTGAKVLLRYYKQGLTSGVLIARPTYYLNNIMGDLDQMATMVGFDVAFRQSARNLAQNLLAVPGVANAARMFGPDKLKKLSDLLVFGSIGKGVTAVMDGADTVITLNGRAYHARDLYLIGSSEGVGGVYASAELVNDIGDLFKERGVLGRAFAANAQAVRDVAELISARQHWGLFLTLIDAGVEPRIAAKKTVDALYDYVYSLHQIDKHILVQLFHPFWNFEKNNARRTARAFLTPGIWASGFFSTPTWRMKQLWLAKESTSQLLTRLLDVRDPYGFDRGAMTEEEQQQYDAAVAKLQARGMGPKEVRAALFNGESVEELDPFVVDYWAPDPTSQMLPEYLYNRFMTYAPYRRSGAMADWLLRGEGRTEEPGDDWRGIPWPDDSNIAGIGLILGSAAVLTGAIAALDDPGAKARLNENAKKIVGDPARNPAVVFTLGTLLGYDMDAYARSLPPHVGALLHKTFGPRVSFASRTVGQAESEGASAQLTNQYKMPAGTAALMDMLGGLGPLLTTAMAVDKFFGAAPGKGPGQSDLGYSLAETLAGQKTYPLSARGQADKDAAQVKDAVANATRDIENNEAALVPPSAETMRKDALELEREALRTMPKPERDRKVIGVFSRYYQRAPRDAGDITTLRALALDLYPLETVKTWDDNEVLRHAPELAKYYVPRMASERE
jgi:hypothetical protein